MSPMSEPSRSVRSWNNDLAISPRTTVRAARALPRRRSGGSEVNIVAARMCKMTKQMAIVASSVFSPGAEIRSLRSDDFSLTDIVTSSNI